MEEASAPDLDKAVVKFGGYWNIPWDKWDEAVARYNEERREQLLQDRMRQR